ncbi:DUF397 domain-containing protein [Streptomyces sp. ZYX-F-203]
MTEAPPWRKSSYSDGGNGNTCVEVAEVAPTRMAIRDTKTPDRGVLSVTATAFTAFVGHVKASHRARGGVRWSAAPSPAADTTARGRPPVPEAGDRDVPFPASTTGPEV